MASLRLLSIGLGTAVLMPMVGRSAAASLGAGFGSRAVTMALLALGGTGKSGVSNRSERTDRSRPTAPRHR